MRRTPKFGIKVPFYPLELIYESALLAEKNGFDSVWSADHVVAISTRYSESYSVWSILGALAVKTQRTLIGSSVSDPCRFHPAVLAQMAMTLSEISNHRFVLGIGAGEAQNVTPYGLNCDHPVGRLEESVRIIRGLLKGEEFSYEGKFFKTRRAIIRPKDEEKVKIWMAANSKRTLSLTGQMADGWLPLGAVFQPRAYQSALHSIQETAHNSGRESEVVEPSLFVHMAMAKTENEARAMAEVPGKLILLGWAQDAFRDFQESIKDFDYKRLVFNSETSGKLESLLNRLPSHPVQDRLIVGTPSQCLEKLDAYLKAGAGHVVLSLMCPPDRLPETIDLIKVNVLSYYQG